MRRNVKHMTTGLLDPRALACYPATWFRGQLRVRRLQGAAADTHPIRRVRRVLTVASAAAVAIVVVGPTAASAAVPDHGTFTIHETFVDPDFCAAEGFSLDVVHDETIRSSVFFDSTGTFRSAIIHHDVQFAISANGHTLHEHDQWTSLISADFAERIVGDFAHISGPGPGLIEVQHDAGQIVINPDGSVAVIHGPHPQFLGETFCFALLP